MEQNVVSIISFSDTPKNESERVLDGDRVLAGAPHHKIKSFFANDSGDVVAGIWTSTPGKWRAFEGRDEFCYIIDGHVRLTDAAGRERSFKTGDAFLIPNGFAGSWEVVETTTKHYVIRHYPQS